MRALCVCLLKEIWRNYKFKLREGFSFENLKLPKRIFETPTQFGLLDKAYMEETLQEAKEEIMKLVQGI